MRSLMLTGLVVLLGGCAGMFPTTVPEAAGEYKPTGEVHAYDTTSTFDAVRVRAPRANLTKRTDGSWGGTLGDRGVDVSVDETHIRGAELLLSREDSTANHTVITGQFQGRIFRFEWDEAKALVRTPSKSLTYQGRVVTEGITKYGPQGDLELRGEASLEKAPWPQIAFALIAAFF
jgi:hypothetical protein